MSASCDTGMVMTSSGGEVVNGLCLMWTFRIFFSESIGHVRPQPVYKYVNGINNTNFIRCRIKMVLKPVE